MKKILLLGGSTQQIPAIEQSKQLGYYTVLCDYLKDNPGQHYSDKFINESTTNVDAILDVAKKENVNAIVAYASDPAAPTAAIVAEKLVLPTNPSKSIEKLAFKNKFREFLFENGFNTPLSLSFKNYEAAKSNLPKFRFPVMIKPIDSSGSKGVSKVINEVDLKKYFDYAMENSRNKEVIIEEFIEQDHQYMVGGDCFVLDGEVAYWGLLNCHRSSKVNPLVPIGKSYPLLISENRINKIKEEIQRVVNILDIKFGGFNLEVMVDKQDRVFLIEMGPRNGGNMIPDLLHDIDDVNLVEATIENAMGNKYNFKSINKNEGYYATYNVHTNKNGKFDGILFKNDIEKLIYRKYIYKNINDNIYYFDSSNKAIGIIFIKFDTHIQQTEFFKNPENWVEVLVK